MRIRSFARQLLWVALLVGCRWTAATPTPATTPVLPTAVPTAEATEPFPAPSPGPTAVPPCLTVTPASQTLPAGSSARFRLAVGPPCATTSYAFGLAELPPGWATAFLGSPTPYGETIVVTASGTAAPGLYRIGVSATSDAGLTASAGLAVQVVPCIQFQGGEFTQAMQSNLVTLITAGKPSIEHGLLVPLQVCGAQGGRRLLVTLLEAVAEAGSEMAAPLRFYLYRSSVWPAPDSIIAHGTPGALNVQLPRVESAGWRLEADVVAGLYLLVFERDYWGLPSDPRLVPASLTYRLTLLP